MNKKALIVTRVSGFVPQFEMNNVKILQEMGYEVHYASNFNTVVYGNDNRRLMDTGIVRHPIPFERSPFSRNVFACYQMLKQLMIEQDFDLVHCHMPMTGVLARQAAKAAGARIGKHIPVVYTAHGFHFYKGAPLSNWGYYLIERHYARYTDRLLLINREDHERGSRFQVRGKTEYVPGVGVRPMPEPAPGFDLHERYGIPSGHKVVVSAGELTERKNHRVMLQAMDRFRREPLSFILCGTGPLEKELQRMAEEMHLQENVVFAGYCENICDILRQADFFAFPSKQEGLPVAVMEAMQAGLPVIGLNIRGNRDLIQDGEGGFLLNEDLPEDYAKALRYFMKYPKEAERMGEWNREKVKAFTLDVVDKEMRRIYAELEREG